MPFGKFLVERGVTRLAECWHNPTAAPLNGQNRIVQSMGNKNLGGALLATRHPESRGKGNDVGKQIAIGQTHGEGIGGSIGKACDRHPFRIHRITPKGLGQSAIEKRNIGAINDRPLSTSAQLNPKPKMLCCPLRGQHSILGFGFNCDHLLITLATKESA